MNTAAPVSAKLTQAVFKGVPSSKADAPVTTLALTKERVAPGFVSYKTDVDYKRPVAWATITSGYKRTITLVWYNNVKFQIVQEEGFKSIKAARARLEAALAEVSASSCGNVID